MTCSSCLCSSWVGWVVFIFAAGTLAKWAWITFAALVVGLVEIAQAHSKGKK